MAARFWRRILGLALALAVASAILLTMALSLPSWTVGAVALAVLLAMPAAFVTGTFAISRSARNPWQALPGEIAAFTLAVVAMSRDARQRPPAQDLPAPHPARPVLLLHGLLDR